MDFFALSRVPFVFYMYFSDMLHKGFVADVGRAMGG
jgi:hypothetical protein